MQFRVFEMVEGGGKVIGDERVRLLTKKYPSGCHHVCWDCGVLINRFCVRR